MRSRYGSSCSFFSILSATCVCISAAVAPDQETFTTMVLMVKEGSSARPSLRNEYAPAAPRMRIMNRTSARWVIAHSERLKRFITRLPSQLGFLFRLERSTHVDGANALPGDQLLHAERHDLVAVLHATGDQRRILVERRERHWLQAQLAVGRNDVDGGTVAAIDDGRERELGNIVLAYVRERHDRGHAERDHVVGIGDREARRVSARGCIS